MSTLTNPMASEGDGQIVGAVATTPMMAGVSLPGGESVAAVASGIATQFWAELVAYPPGSARSLWLNVGGVWKRYDNAPNHMEEMVQRSVGSGQTVRIWYEGEKIVGLVVNS